MQNLAAGHAKSVLVLSFTDLATDPRVHRQIRALSDRYHVLAAGTAPPGIREVEFFAVPPRETRRFARKALSALLLKLGRYERYYWSQPQVRWCLSALAQTRPAVIIANDVSTLPLALRLKSARGVILDAHEYAPRELEDRFGWRFFFQRYNDYLCRKYLADVAGMTTVCRSIADEYRTNYGVASEVVMNVPPYHDLRPGRTDTNAVRMVHHGGAIPSRRIELMIELMDHLEPRFQLDLMLVPTDERYFGRLRALANRRPRVRMVDPVPMRELPHRLNQYDIGLFLLPPTNLNYHFALPNKFFEFVQARLAVAIGPSPEMARLVRQYGCGIVSDDFDPVSLARRLNGLDAGRIASYKKQSHLAARELCFEKNAEVLLGMVDRVAGAA
jgi:hypothetical protein